MKGGRRRSRSASRGRSARRSRSASRGRSARRSRRGGTGASGNMLKLVAPTPAEQQNLVNAAANSKYGNLITFKDGSSIQKGFPQNGGRKRKGRGKKGGFLGQLINQALVPFGLLGMQHAYGKRSRKHRS